MAGFRGLLYTLAKLMGDYNAVKKGKVGKRVGRRVAGKATGKAMGKLFKYSFYGEAGNIKVAQLPVTFQHRV